MTPQVIINKKPPLTFSLRYLSISDHILHPYHFSNRSTNMTLFKLLTISCAVLFTAFIFTESSTTRRSHYHRQEYYYDVQMNATGAHNISVDGKYYLTTCPDDIQWFLCSRTTNPLCLLNGTVICITQRYSRCRQGFCINEVVAGFRLPCISFAKIWNWERWLPESSNITFISQGGRGKRQEYKVVCVTTRAEPRKRVKH